MSKTTTATKAAAVAINVEQIEAKIHESYKADIESARKNLIGQAKRIESQAVEIGTLRNKLEAYADANEPMPTMSDSEFATAIAQSNAELNTWEPIVNGCEYNPLPKMTTAGYSLTDSQKKDEAFKSLLNRRKKALRNQAHQLSRVISSAIVKADKAGTLGRATLRASNKTRKVTFGIAGSVDFEDKDKRSSWLKSQHSRVGSATACENRAEGIKKVKA